MLDARFDEAIRAATRRTAVRVMTGTHAGSGFFARRGIILTCAHVVGSAEIVTVTWGDDDECRGRVRLRMPEHDEPGADENWPSPDIAVVELIDPPPHPIPFFSASAPLEGETLLAYGFTDGTLQRGPVQDGVLLTTTAMAGDYQRVRDDVIGDGLSGSIVVSTTSGLVVGMIKAARDPVTSLGGGWIIPGRELTKALDKALGASEPEFDVGGWTDAHLSPIMPVLKGQLQAAATLPYRLLDGPLPVLGEVYVAQNTKGSGGPIDIPTMLAEHRHAVIIGPPGSGKTSLVQRICRESAEWWMNRDGPPPFGLVVPVRATAASFAADRPFLDSLASSVNSQLGPMLDEPLTTKVFYRRPLPGVTWLILVDGLDEVIDSKQRRTTMTAIGQRAAASETPQRIVVTSRPLPDNDMKLVGRVPALDLLLFERPQMELFAKRWFLARREIAGARTDDEAEEIARRFVDQVDQTEARSLAGVPLLLTIAAIVFERSPTELPATIATLYERFVDLLLSRDAATPPDIRSGSPLAEIWERRAQLLEATAFRWFFGGGSPIFDVALEIVLQKESLGVTDTPELQSHLHAVLRQTGVVVVTGGVMEWIHLSVAEYLASRLLVRKKDPQKWIWLARDPATANVARLALVQAASRGDGLPFELVRRLTDGRSSAFGLEELLGTPRLLSRDTVMRLTREAEATGWLDGAPYAAHPAGAEVLREAAQRASTRYRRERAATALIRSGSLDDAKFGVAAMSNEITRLKDDWKRLQAMGALISAIAQRADETSFEDDVRRIQESAVKIIRGLRSRTGLAWTLVMPSVLPVEERRQILLDAYRSDSIPARLRMRAAAALALSHSVREAFDVIEEASRRTTRVGVVWPRLGGSGLVLDERTAPRLAGQPWNRLARVAVVLASIFGPLVALLWHPMTGNGFQTGSASVVGAIVAWTLVIGCLFSRPWWRRPTRSAERARDVLYRFVDAESSQFGELAMRALGVGTRTRRQEWPLTLVGWVTRQEVRDRTVNLALAYEALRRLGTTGPDGDHPAERRSTHDDRERPLDVLRGMLSRANGIDRRAIASAIYDHAYVNPRTARTFVLLLRDVPDLNPRLQRKISNLLEIVDDDDF